MYYLQHSASPKPFCVNTTEERGLRNEADRGGVRMISAVIRTVHLASFGAWFGSQVWVTFFAGTTIVHTQFLYLQSYKH